MAIRWISLSIFVLGAFAFIGANSYKDFYYELRARSSGEWIDFQTLGEFCGWTGGLRPGETNKQRGLRSAWNMLSAMLGMSALAFLAFAIVFALIVGIFYWKGSFD